jgi:hypothetical protein
MFLTTYDAELKNLNIRPEEITNIMIKNLHKPVIVVNSNYGHGALPEYSYLIKQPKNLKNKKNKPQRRKQGDGSCFSSAVEPIIKISDDNSTKIYKLKCFPSAGKIQIPGVIKEDYSDGHEVLIKFVEYLNTLGLGETISIVNEKMNMVNYKFELLKDSNNILVNLMSLAYYLQMMEDYKYIVNEEQPEIVNEVKNFMTYKEIIDSWNIIKPPYYAREIKFPLEDCGKMSFKMIVLQKRFPRITIFRSGKINILGGVDRDTNIKIYEFLNNLFRENWDKLITFRPEKDITDSEYVKKKTPKNIKNPKTPKCKNIKNKL